MRRVAVGPSVLAIGIMLAAARAFAGDPAGDAPGAKAAFDAFLEGERAFAAGDFVRAAESFEAAHRIAAHPDVLWNAARAWERAGEAVRAANLYERYLKEAPPGARDRDGAIEARKRLAARLGRVDVIAPGARDLRVDDQPLTGDRRFVTPGAHVISGAIGDRRVTKTATVAAGEAVSVALVDEPAPAIDKPPPAPTIVVVPPPPAPAARPLLATWQRAIVGAGFGLTAASGALLVWSGVDTARARSSFDRGPTPEALERGRDKQLRTNVLIGTTAALGVLSIGATLVFAITGRAPSDPSPAVALDRNGATLLFGGRF